MESSRPIEERALVTAYGRFEKERGSPNPLRLPQRRKRRQTRFCPDKKPPETTIILNRPQVAQCMKIQKSTQSVLPSKADQILHFLRRISTSDYKRLWSNPDPLTIKSELLNMISGILRGSRTEFLHVCSSQRE